MTTLQIFDVEHGGCALLTCPNGMRMMIDCGHNATLGWYPGDHLHRLGVRHLQMLVVTNYDQDHVSGFPDLIDQVLIGSIYRNVSVTPSGIRHLKSTDGILSTAMDRFIDTVSYRFGPPGSAPVLQFPSVEWSMHLNPYPVFDDENNLSLALRLKVGQVTFLFPGDLETAGWRHLLRSDQLFAGVVRETTVLVAAHHGRENGNCPELFDQFGCHPELIVISDDSRQFDTQDTTSYYASKVTGIRGFRGWSRSASVDDTKRRRDYLHLGISRVPRFLSDVEQYPFEGRVAQINGCSLQWASLHCVFVEELEARVGNRASALFSLPRAAWPEPPDLLTHVLTHIADTKVSRIEDLLPWT